MTDPRDLLGMPLGELLARLLRPEPPATSQWVDVRDPASPVPYRQALAAAQRGELAVHRVGRRGLVRREELDAWIAKQPVIGAEPESAPPTTSDAARILERAGWRRAG